MIVSASDACGSSPGGFICPSTLPNKNGHPADVHFYLAERVGLLGFRVASAKPSSLIAFGTAPWASCASSWWLRHNLKVSLYRNKPLHGVLSNPAGFFYPSASPNKNGHPTDVHFYLAERVGFEPTVGSHLRLISSQVHSTTLPPLRGRDFTLTCQNQAECFHA